MNVHTDYNVAPPPDLSTLPQRMRWAARVLQEVFQRDPVFEKAYRSPADFFIHPWQGKGLKLALCELADCWEAEERETTERDALAAQLSMDLFNTGIPFYTDCLDAARQLIESGWRKGDPK